jgi:tRNA G18 (ribose-2'-O)-methylase SpoU
MKMLIPILYNIRSVHNVGSILRTCDGLGINQVAFVGYTPNPKKGLPHEQEKLTEALHKTALGAEQTVSGVYFKTIDEAIDYYRRQNYDIYALEQAENSCNLANTDELKNDTVLILGEEVHGIDRNILEKCDKILEIPMFGTKESFNVSVATAMALYELKRSDLQEI